MRLSRFYINGCSPCVSAQKPVFNSKNIRRYFTCSRLSKTAKNLTPASNFQNTSSKFVKRVHGLNFFPYFYFVYHTLILFLNLYKYATRIDITTFLET